jgi:hypothetical protein
LGYAEPIRRFGRDKKEASASFFCTPFTLLYQTNAPHFAVNSVRGGRRAQMVGSWHHLLLSRLNSRKLK